MTPYCNSAMRLRLPPRRATSSSWRACSIFCLDLAQIAAEHKTDILRVANVYYRLGAKLDLHWFLEQINHQPVGNHWQAMARASFREDLDWQQRSLTSVVLEGCKEQGECATILADWISEHEQLLSRWTHMLADFKTTSTHEFAKFSVALRELNLLQLNCRTSA